MDTLKKLTTLLLIAIFGISIQLHAQNDEAIIKAFEESYGLETAGDYKKAADVLKKVYNSNSYELNLRLGWLNYQAGMFNESVSHYQKATDLMPLSIEAKFGLIYPLAAIGKWEEVENVYKNILKITPNNTLANYRLGLVYYGQEKFELAHACFKKVADLYPFDYDGLLMYAWTNLKLSKTREANILFNKVLMLSPGDKSALEGLGYIK